MRIKVAVVREKGAAFVISDAQLEDPRDDEVLVRLVACGICASDLSARQQAVPVPMPIVLGHEGAGVVQATGRGVTKLSVGDHVVLSRLSCGKCPPCMEGDRNFCRHTMPLNLSGARLDGSSGISDLNGVVHGQFFGQSSFATHCLAHEQNATKVPQSLDLAIAPAFACGTLTGAGTIMSGIRPRAGSSVAIFGAGTVGLSAALAARAVGCTKIVVVDINQDRLDLAASIAATHTINATAYADVVGAIREILPWGADVSIEATGKAQVAQAAVSCLAPKGVCAMLGVGALGQLAPIDQTAMAFSGITVKGFPTGTSEPDVLIPVLVELYEQGRFPIDRLVTRFSLNDINAAAEAMQTGQVVKPVILM